MFRILWDPSSGSIKSASLKLLAMFCVRSRCLVLVALNLSHQTHTPQVQISRCQTPATHTKHHK